MRPTATSRPGTELGVFLRTRRDRLAPEDAGLARGQGVRRTPGLRREELAALAGISIDYYVRLERGTERHPSAAVIDALAKALQLDDDEHDHLRRLAAQVDRRNLVANIAPTRHTRAGIRLILESLRPFPAYVTNRIGDVLASNPGGLRMLAGIEDWPATQRNVARFAFLHPAARDLYGNWTAQLTGVVSGLRMLAAVEPDAQDLRNLVGELLVKSPEFVKMWEKYDIDPPTAGRKRLHHPVVGDISIGYQVMQLQGTDGQALLSYYAEEGTPEYDQILLLDRLEEDSAHALEPAALDTSDADTDPAA